MSDIYKWIIESLGKLTTKQLIMVAENCNIILDREASDLETDTDNNL